jgi:hypothetical protein
MGVNSLHIASENKWMTQKRIEEAGLPILPNRGLVSYTIGSRALDMPFVISGSDLPERIGAR